MAGLTPEQFQERFMPYAVAASQRTGLDPRLILAQSALETGYGRSAPNNNFFGIKSHGQSGGSNLMTQEFENGRMVDRSQSFRGYESPEQSFQGYADFILNNPRYGRVMEQGDLAGQIGAMGASGYATDPEYARKLASIAGRFGGEVDPSQFSTRNAADTPQAVGRDTRSALGLLSNGDSDMMPPRQGGPMPEEERGMFGMSKDTQDKLAMGLMSLSHRPNQQMMNMVQGRMADRREGRQGAQQRNATAEWLRSQGAGDMADGVMAGALTGAQAMQIMQQRSAPPEVQDPFSTIGKLQADLSAGRITPAQYEQAAASIGAPTTTVENNIGAGETAFDKRTGEILANEADEVVQQASMAQRSMGQLNTLEQALENSPEGAGGAIANMAANIGIKTEGASSIELANAIISQLVPQQRPPGSGVMSDADLALFKASLPRLINTREGNQLIINTMRNIAGYDMERGAIARRLQLGEIEPADAFAAYNALGNPLSAFQNADAPPSTGGGGNTLTFNPETGAFD